MISIVLISGDMNGQDNPSMLWSFNEYQEYHFFIIWKHVVGGLRQKN